MNDIKPRIVYLLRRTDKEDDGKDIYVGSTSKTLKERLKDHRGETQRKGKVNKSKLYTRMVEIGVNNWEVVPLLSFTCDKKTILKFEREWCELLHADLNMRTPFSGFNNNKEYIANHYRLNKQNKVFHCNICEKSFESNWFLKRHLDTLKHQYAYLNSLD